MLKLTKQSKMIFGYGGFEAISRILNRLTIIIIPLLSNLEVLGMTSLIVSSEILLPVIISQGLDKVFIRFYGKDKDIVIYNYIVNKIAANTIIIIIFLVISHTIFYKYINISMMTLIAIVINSFLISILYLNQMKNRVEEKIFTYSINRFLFQSLKIIFVVIALKFLKTNELGYLYASIISLLITLVVIFKLEGYILKDYIKDINYKDRKIIQKQGFWMMANFLNVNLSKNIDKYMLYRYLTVYDLGVYTFAQTISGMLSFFYQALSMYYEPMIFKQNLLLYKIKIIEYLKNTYNVVSLFILIGLIIYSFELCYEYLNEFVKYDKYMIVLIISQLMYSYYFSSNYKLQYEYKSKIMAFSSIITSVLSLFIIFILAKHQGLSGAFIGLVISIILNPVILYHFTWKKISYSQFMIIASIIMIISSYTFIAVLLLIINQILINYSNRWI